MDVCARRLGSFILKNKLLHLLFLKSIAISCGSSPQDDPQGIPSRSHGRPLVFVPGFLLSAIEQANVQSNSIRTYENLNWKFIWDEDFPIFSKNKFREGLSLPEYDWELSQIQTRTRAISHFRIIPFLYSVDVYQDLWTMLETRLGYRRDQDFHLWSYDWRQPISQSAKKLQDFLRDLASKQTTPQPLEIDLLTESSGANVAAHALRERNLNIRIRNWILLSPSLGGTPVAQRVFLSPPNSGFRLSAIVPSELVPQVRSLYSLMPITALSEITRNESLVDFSYRELERGEQARPAPWIGAEAQRRWPTLTQRGEQERQDTFSLWADLGRAKQQIKIRAAQSWVIASRCHDTYGTPGDKVVPAWSHEHSAQVTGAALEWVCARHEAVPRNPQTLFRVFEILK